MDKQLSMYDIYDNEHEYIRKICDLEKSSVPLTTKVEIDEYTDIAQANFDYQFDGVSKFYPFLMNEDIAELDFNILAIVGASGSGKSTFSKYYGEDEQLEWDNNKAIISHFDSPSEACEKLIASGISSIPTWCKPRNVLSVGEGFRADIARKLKDNCVIDEFTSNVDRNVALSCAASISKYIRQKNLKKCVFVSCHKDFIDTLCPDYVIDLDDQCVYDTRRLPRRRFKLSLFVSQDKEKTWEIFRKHHYMTQDLSKSATLYTLYMGETIVACCYILAFPNGFIQNGWRIHRLVVLPDYQGLGIGTKFFVTMCDIYKYWHSTIYMRTSHVKLCDYMRRHTELFAEAGSGGHNYAKEAKKGCDKKYTNFKNNIAYSFKYIADCKYDKNIDYEAISINYSLIPRNYFGSYKQITFDDM